MIIETGNVFINSDSDRFAPITVMGVVKGWIVAAKPTGTPFLYSKKDFIDTFIKACKYTLKQPKYRYELSDTLPLKLIKIRISK